MDNNELDKVLKEKLKVDIKPSQEFEAKIKQKIEEEKIKAKSKEFKQPEQEVKKERKKFKTFSRVLSIAAVVVIVFAIGMNLQNAPLLNIEQKSNLVSISAIEPTKLEGGILSNNSEFIIKVEGNNVSVEDIQKSIYIEPALEYTIEKTLNSNEYKLKFKQNIPDNTILKLQYVKNKITQDSWAYQTSKKLSITKTYPADNSQDVSKNTVIDIEISYASIENLENYVEITPNIEGAWSHIGNIWRFSPAKELEEREYKVKVKKGIKAEDEVLEEDYEFNFFVGKNGYGGAYYESLTLDGILTLKPDEKGKIVYNKDEKVNVDTNNIEIRRFENIEEFKNYVESQNYDNAKEYKTYGAKDIECKEDYRKCIELQNTLPSGFYVAIVKNTKGKELFNVPIQVSNLATYSMVTERDVLFWVAKENDLANGIEVEYLGKKIKTDNQGIAKFENITDNSKKVKYAKVEDELLIGICNYSFENYPNCYIYTDRPLYKNTDTINIWGFVPKSLFYGNVEDEFYIELGNEGRKKINIEENGNFVYKIDLKNHFDVEIENVTLYYKDQQVATRYITIQNYELQNYTFEVINNKKYGIAGTNYEFDVKVTHITGLNVPNKKVTIECGDFYKDTKLTDENGIAHFSIYLEDEEEVRSLPIYYKNIRIFNGDENEYNKNDEGIDIPVLQRDVYGEELNEDNTYKLKLHKLDQTKDIKVSYDGHELYNGEYETEVEVKLIEEISERYIENYYYSEYKKENVPNYRYNNYKGSIKNIKKVKSTNGLVEVKKEELGSLQKSTEDKRYSYTLELSYKDQNNKKILNTFYVSNNNSAGTLVWFSGEAGESPDYDLYINEWSNYSSERYDMYRYFLNKEDGEGKKFNIGDNIELKLESASESEIKNEGKLLYAVFKENISKVDVTSENTINYKFEQTDFPGIKIVSSYFKDGKFYRMPPRYFDFNEETKNVNIEIKTDKQEYKPGEEVNLELKVTNNGKPIKTDVNISVVNEAVFNIEDDYINLTEQIYLCKSYPIYTYSSYTDFLFEAAGGAGGGGDGTTRANFADTAYFGKVSTDKNGIAKLTFKMPDNVTTYRITAQSANEDLYLGVNKQTITSKLDFFVQSTSPRGLKDTDDVVLNATAVTPQTQEVEYEFTIKEINKTLTAKGISNVYTTSNFGKLDIGSYHAVIKAKVGEVEDSIEYEFTVSKGTQEIKTKTTTSINQKATIKPTKNPIVLEIYNKELEKYVKYIDFIESTTTERLDTQIAYNEVQNIKEKIYGSSYTINYINNMFEHFGENNYLKNLKNSKEDLILTALTKFYAKDYSQNYYGNESQLRPEDNVFEYYLIKSAENKPVLNDLIYLKEEENIENYNKLLVTLSLEFVGDFQNAKDLYNKINLNEEEKEKYKSIIAIIETFINKKEVSSKIDEIIEKNPADEYVRFAILSYFENNMVELSSKETVKLTAKNIAETFEINPMQVKTYVINDEDLSEINFETTSNNLIVSYYYQTSIENIENQNLVKDITLKSKGEFKKTNTIQLQINFGENYKYEGNLRIALPNSLRLAKNYNTYDGEAKYYVQANNIDYVTIYKTKECKSIILPLLVINEGNYKFESIVCKTEDTYHISEPFELNIK